MQMKTANNGTHEYLLTSHYALGIRAEQITGFICPINSEAVRWGRAAPVVGAPWGGSPWYTAGTWAPHFRLLHVAALSAAVCPHAAAPSPALSPRTRLSSCPPSSGAWSLPPTALRASDSVLQQRSRRKTRGWGLSDKLTVTAEGGKLSGRRPGG